MMNTREASLRKMVAMVAESGISALAFSSTPAYYDAYRRVDREGTFHTEWQ